MADKESIPSSYGHYRIVSQLGSGGMGAVYLADDQVLDRQVALKILHADVAQDHERIRRFIHEAKAASALNHPNILTIFEVGEEHGTHYLVTELIRGQTLREMMRKGNIDLLRKVDISVQIASALDAAHQNGLIHRDIKPENIMVRGDNLVKVLDFGLAKLTRPRDPAASDVPTLEHNPTDPGVRVGTTAYMSPEQARGVDLDGRSDAFSLGIVFYELFTGRHPFTGENHADVVSAILKENPAPVSQRAPELPKELERIIEKLLRKDRETRYQVIKDLRLDLEDLRDELRYGSRGSHSEAGKSDGSSDTHEHASVRSAFTSNIVEKRRFTALHAMIFLAAAGLCFAGFWLLWSKLYPSPREPGSYPTTEIAIWSSAAGELFTDASFSPDGKMIAYSSTRSGSSNLWVVQTNSSNALQITDDGASNSAPIWSPKGDEIAFFSDRSRVTSAGSNVTGIWRVPAFGGSARLIAPVEGDSYLRHWASSGKIYFQLDGNLHALDVNTGQMEHVTTFEANKFQWLTVSQDEKSIAYLSRENDKWSIKTSNLDGSNLVEAAAGTGDVGSRIAWSRDKERFFYREKVAGIAQVFMTGGGTSIRLTAAETDTSVADVSPDGRSIIIGSEKEEANLWRVSLADGRETPIVKNLDENLWPAVSPDNRRIVYQAVRNLARGDKLFESSIMVKNIVSTGDGGRANAVAENGFLPIWSPDGRRIAFLRKLGGKAELMIADPDVSTEARPISSGIPLVGYSVWPYNPMYYRAVAWSPDNSSIAYTSDKTGASNLWTIKPDGSSDHSVTDNTDPNTKYYSPVWSDDGSRLAYSYQTKAVHPEQRPSRGLVILDLGTGRTTKLFQTNAVTRLLGWNIDEKGLIVAEAPKEFVGQAQETTLKSVPVDGSTPTEIVRIPSAYYFNILVSEDKKTIAYAAREGNTDDIWIVPVTGGTPRKLTANNDTDLYFSRLAWFHDGNSIVFGKQTRFSLLSLITDID